MLRGTKPQLALQVFGPDLTTTLVFEDGSTRSLVPITFSLTCARVGGSLGHQRVIELFMDVFNVTDRANFENPSGDVRLTATFVRLATLYGGSGFPRQAQLGIRFEF